MTSTATANQLENSRCRVEYLLKNYPALRDSDKKLWISYLVMFHSLRERLLEAHDPYEAFCDLYLDKSVPSHESIRRNRQKIQQNGKYVGKSRKARPKPATEKINSLLKKKKKKSK